MQKYALLTAAFLSLALLTGCFEDDAKQDAPAPAMAAQVESSVVPQAGEIVENPAGGTADAVIMQGGEEHALVAPEPPPAPAPTALSANEWIAEDIKNGGVIDRLQLTLRIEPDGKISGHSGCNRFGGQADMTDVAAGKVSLGALFSTRMACMDEARNNQEMAFLAALGEVSGWRTENGLLYLTDDDGADILRFSNADHMSKPAEELPAE